MRKLFVYGAVFIFIFSLSPIAAVAQAKNTTDVPIKAIVYEPAMLAPTHARINSLKLPAGFQIAKFAEISNPRMLAIAKNGTVYVSQRNPGTLTMLRDTNGDGAADIQKVVAEKKMLHGIFIDGDQIYIVTVKEVFEADIKSDGMLGELRMIIDDLPDGGQHPNRTLAVRDGKLFLSVGSTCNACDETTPEAATMLVTDLEGKNRRIFASGLRNTIGFGWHPVSKKFFGMDHGIDWLGDDDQREELNEIIDGSKYGWPYVYADGKLNPQDEPPPKVGLTNQDWANQSQNPLLMYTAHAAPMQMVFYTGSQFPTEYKNDGFVAFRGSWNRSQPSGYEVARVRFNKSGSPVSFEPFLTGFLVKGASPEGKDAKFGRPVGLGQMPDGSLLVTDDTSNIIYRITYGKSVPPPPIMTRENVAMMLLTETANTSPITVTSSSFSNMGMLANKYSAYYEDISPELQWSGVPRNTKSLVLMMEDPDAAVKPVTHWIVANIPPTVTGFPENISKTEKYGEAVQGGNHTGKLGYYGPMPPRDDGAHKYHFQIFALDRVLDLPSGFNRQALLDSMKGHVVGKGQIIGTYQRTPDIRTKE